MPGAAGASVGRLTASRAGWWQRLGPLLAGSAKIAQFKEAMDIHVRCVSSESGGEDPAVVWFGQRELPVLAVLDRWFGADHRWWKVTTRDGQYILRRADRTGEWDLAAVPRIMD